MTRFLSVVTTIAVALWVGGLAALMLLVGGLFARSHELGVEAAPVLFEQFAYYHLIVGGIALVGAVLWRMRSPSRWLTTLAVCVAIGLAAALVTEMFISPKMHQLQRDGQSGDAAFASLHRTSETTYGIEALAALVACGLLPACIRRTERRASGMRTQTDQPALAAD